MIQRSKNTILVVIYAYMDIITQDRKREERQMPTGSYGM